MSGGRDGAACGWVSQLLAKWWRLHQISGVPLELGARLSCLAGARWKGKGTGCALGLRVFKLGQLSWDFSHSSVLLSSMDFTYAYGVCWSCGEGPAMARIMRFVGLGRTDSNGWQQWWFSLRADLTPTGCLMKFLLSGYAQVYFSTITQSSNHWQKNIMLTVGWFFPYHLNLRKFPNWRAHKRNQCRWLLIETLFPCDSTLFQVGNKP